MTKEQSNLQRQAKAFSYRVLVWGKTKVPTGLRSVVGVVFMVGGAFGFLPILGFWMLPLGLALIALDLPPTRKIIERWMERLETDLDP